MEGGVYTLLLRLSKRTGSGCVVEAGSWGGLARVGSAAEMHHAVLVWRGSGAFSRGVRSQA